MGWKKKRGEREYWKSFQPSNINHVWGEYAEWAEKEPYQYVCTSIWRGGDFWPRVLAALFPFIKIKGSVSQDLIPNFPNSNPSGPLTKRLKHFRFFFYFTEIFKFKKVSTVCIPPWSQTLRCASDCRVWLRSVHHTAESATSQVSVLIRSVTIVISLWCLYLIFGTHIRFVLKARIVKWLRCPKDLTIESQYELHFQIVLHSFLHPCDSQLQIVIYIFKAEQAVTQPPTI